MAAFLLRRVLQGVIVVAIVATIVFTLIHLAPGDPFSSALENPTVTESVRETWRRAYGLDRPLSEQYVRYLGSVLRGDLGFSFSLQRPVADAIGDALPNTLLLMSAGLFGGFALGIAVALAQVRRHRRRTDRVLGSVSLALFSVPDFWLALLILVVFAWWIPIFPIGGAVDPVMYDMLSPAGQLADRARHLVLPALTLTLLYFPLIARHQRAALLDVLPSDYVTTARAKGVRERAVISRHALRNALLPIITLLGVAFPALLTGAVFIEKVFAWPGMGSLIVGSIGSRDYPLLMAAVLMASVFVVTGSILADLLYRWLDPRMRDER
ncbi:MAG TPA: ABC transporter permease [Gemmatimonadaceae bacterium]|nr:ABC transporter permease [Gemmatimonadaceae bacterium]